MNQKTSKILAKLIITALIVTGVLLLIFTSASADKQAMMDGYSGTHLRETPLPSWETMLSVIVTAIIAAIWRRFEKKHLDNQINLLKDHLNETQPKSTPPPTFPGATSL